MPAQADMYSFTIMRRKATAALVRHGVTLGAAATFTGCSISTVSRNIKRINKVGNVADLERSGRPCLYSEELRLRLIGFYCQTQPLPNSGRWTIRWAATYLEQHPEIINARPSKSSIQRILKENNLKPHQSRYFLHITDPNFFPKMNHLIALYLNPPQNLFFFDECPGIQILKRLTPDIRTDETARLLEEFEYIRNGTMNVLAFFNYADGKVYAECKA
jgi:transposase